jgi:hypothetical protein
MTQMPLEIMGKRYKCRLYLRHLLYLLSSSVINLIADKNGG